MKNLFLSIIVPVYNSETVLNRCLDSLIDLNHQYEYEVILVDDGSKDASGKICDAFVEQYSFFKVIHQHNEGVSAARNAGIKSSFGRYLMFVDSDDYISNSCIQIIFDFLNLNNVELLIWNSFNVTNKRINFYPGFEKVFNCKKLSLNETYSMFLKLHNNGPWAKVYSASLIRKFEIFFPQDINLGEDLIFNLDFLKKSNCIFYLSDAMYMNVPSINGLSKLNKYIESINDFDAMFKKMIFFVTDMGLGQEYVNIVNCSILQLVANYSGKLYANGYSKNQIYSTISRYSWYDNILINKYSDFKSVLRKVLLKHKWYFIISKIYNA